MSALLPATAALRDAAVAVMPADLGERLMAATSATALIDACDVAANDPRCVTSPWFDAMAEADAAACLDVRRSGSLPMWWDAGHEDAADRYAAKLFLESL